MTETTKKVLMQSKDYFAIILGLLMVAFGYSAFILPNHVVTGGVTGLATIIYFACNKAINLAIPNYAINVILLLIAFRTVGRQFVLRTIFGASALSLFFLVLTPLFPKPLVSGEPFMSIVIGAVLCGIGLGVTFSHSGSSGGTDIIAAMVNKHSNVSFGRMMLYCDLIIISSSYFIFHQLDNLVYGFVFLVLNAMFSDLAINSRFQGVQFFIFSEKWQAIADAINTDAKRGCTLLSGTGWHSKREVKVLLAVCRKYESVMLQRIVKAIDPDAFISMVNTNGVFGEGFDQMKVHLHKYQPQSQTEGTAGGNDARQTAECSREATR